MADEKPPENPWEIVFFVGGILLVLFVLWWARGGPKEAMSGQGFFVSPTVPLPSNTSNSQ
jgi:hypothetical protein